jgi:archaellum component FlaF (FlaF/FlaG flagellin family)
VPATITAVVGMQRTLSASTQTINNQNYALASWSDGGAATHTILTPATATTYTATFQQAQLPFSALYSTTAPSNWSLGQTQTFTTTLTNTGPQTWNASDPNAVHLGVYFNGNSDAIYDWPSEPARVVLLQDVAPGASVTVNVTVTAPSAPGSYVLRQRLVKENVQWFDQLQATPVTVGSAASLSASYATTAPTTWQPGQTLTFNTTVTNTGALTWNAADPQAVHLGVYFNGNSDNPNDWPTEPARFLLPNDVPAGSSATITVTVTAPSLSGNYVLRQRLVKEDVAWFDQLQKTNVVVGGAAPTVTAVTPAGGAVGVATTTSVSATFSTAIDPATLTSSTFVLVRQGTTTPISAVVTYDSTTKKATLKPSANLQAGATYTATLKGGLTGIKDLAGSPLAADQSWSFTTAATLFNGSQFISQIVPATMKPGQLYTISITMKNTGTKTWDPTSYRLGSANPRDNLTWGLNRVYLTAPVAPGAQVTFRFSVRAPRTIGTYNFQWQMVEEHVTWFGALTSNVKVKVAL